MRVRSRLAIIAGGSLLAAGLGVSSANAGVIDPAETDEVVLVEPSVQCDSEYPSGIVITNPASNTQTFYTSSNVFDASGTPRFGDGGILAPGESLRVASGGSSVNVEDATYIYDVSQSPQVPGTTEPTEPFTVVATGTYVLDCEAGGTDYFVTSYDRTVWAVTPASIRALTFAEWQAAGSPAPKPAPTDYVKYPWSPTVSAVTFFGQPQDRWVWKHISFEEWDRAGKPSPRIAGWIKDSVYYKWATAAQIFVQDVGGVKHALTGDEWAASGWQPFTERINQGFGRLSWDANVARFTDFAAGQGSPINFAQWQTEGQPQPAVQTRFPGDQLYRNYGDPTIWYAGPTVNRPITFAEWSTLGQPAPTVRNIPARPTLDKDCDDYPSRQAAQDEYRYYFEAYGDVFLLDGDDDGIACESYFG
ncbi:hypothetical protein [uncultured Microbacterium sp.]|uniref:hypothetical protein n=1 Tax=uncultured Microbacterium sp. TaxID=191216 RepID=UPI0028D5F8FE|nr:hypothetical protein [uncultured Microbacterium sp.]